MTSAPDTAAVHGLSYRRDIDGLRALAVLPVVFYHFGVPGFGGGFVGVDIFFVISGFLISSILLSDISQSRFSLLRFYERRVRRIIPALGAVIAVTLVAGLFVLPPKALDELGRSAVATLGFVSNIYFWRSTGDYFAGPAEMRPLLHTWSLGVEEQFYILFPIVLALVMRAGRGRATVIACLALVLALAASLWLTPRYPSAAFYLAPTRAWQLLAGGLLALRPLTPPNRWTAEAAAAGGIGLILWSCMTFSEQTLTPGIAALAPCGGALLLIFAGQGGPTALGSRLLALRPLVAIGLISYSLYLWHWPVYVFLRHYILFSPLSPLVAVLGVALAGALAALSWKFVEQPIRKKRLVAARPKLFAAAAAASVAIAAVAGGFVAAKGLPGRYANLAGAAWTAEPEHPEWAPYDNAKCFVTAYAAWDSAACQLAPGTTGRTALLWGDSYANHYATGFLQLREASPLRVIEYAQPRCPPLLGYDSATNPGCAPFNAAVWKVIEAQGVNTVILSAKWESYLGGDRMDPRDIGRTIQALQARGLQVVLVGQSPIFYFGYPDDYYLAHLRGRPAGREDRAEISFGPDLNQRLRQEGGTADFFDPTTVFCEARQCLYRKDGLYLVADSGHYTQLGSRMAVEALLKAPGLGAGE